MDFFQSSLLGLSMAIFSPSVFTASFSLQSLIHPPSSAWISPFWKDLHKSYSVRAHSSDPSFTWFSFQVSKGLLSKGSPILSYWRSEFKCEFKLPLCFAGPQPQALFQNTLSMCARMEMCTESPGEDLLLGPWHGSLPLLPLSGLFTWSLPQLRAWWGFTAAQPIMEQKRPWKQAPGKRESKRKGLFFIYFFMKA